MLFLKCTPLLINKYGKEIVYQHFHRVADKNEYRVHSFPILSLQINHHKHRSLEHTFGMWQFHGFEVQIQVSWHFCSGPHQLNSECHQRLLPLGPPPSSFSFWRDYYLLWSSGSTSKFIQFLTEFSSLWLYNWAPCFLDSCQSGLFSAPRGFPWVLSMYLFCNIETCFSKSRRRISSLLWWMWFV